ncbi:MAG TPA: HAD family phosphatase [Jiangellaceae bacterium]|nr:HAD family phosphatase [Jiangellaceae bacterium]
MDSSVGPPAVVFDLGGVLIDWDPRYLYRRLLASEEEVERFLGTVCTPEWNRAQDAGRSWAEAVDTLAARHPDQAGLIAAYRDRWPEMIAGPFEETVRVLADLRAAGVALYALTNWSAETFPVAQRRFDFLRWFEGTVVSGQEQLVKPDPRLYRLLAQRHGLDLRHSVFIDDTPANVVAARELGMLGLDFVDAERLRADLTAHGLLASGTAAQADRA